MNDETDRLLLMTGQIAAQAKLAYLVVMMAGSGLKSTQRRKGYIQCKQIVICIDRGDF